MFSPPEPEDRDSDDYSISDSQQNPDDEVDEMDLGDGKLNPEDGEGEEEGMEEEGKEEHHPVHPHDHSEE